MVSAVRQMRPMAFLEMWEQFGYDYPPYPLNFRPTADTIEGYVDEQIQAIDEATATLADWYAPAINALTRPEVRVEILGTRRGGLFRAHVGVLGAIACIATQKPGAASDIGGEVTLRAVKTSDVGRALAKLIDVKTQLPLREWRFNDARDDADTAAKRREVEALMANGVESMLPIGVLPGQARDWRIDRDTQSFEIVGVRGVGDLIVNKAAQQIVSASPDRLAGAFDTYISAVKRVHELRR